MAHEFNNKLGVILGHAELGLLKAKKSESIRPHLIEIQDSAKHSADLTKQILTFARKQFIAPKVIDLNEKIAEILQILESLIGENIQII